MTAQLETGSSPQAPAEESLAARLQRFVGLASRPPVSAADPVNQPMIRHWCDAIGDGNPVYTDPEAAGASRHGGVVAPPTMLQVWNMPGLRPEAPPAGEDHLGELMGILDEAGYTAIVATNCEQEYARYLRPGDLLTATSMIEAVSEEKRTALGSGYFINLHETYTDQGGALVGTMMLRVLKFRPEQRAESSPPAAPSRRPRPVVNEDNRFFWDGVARGELLIQRCTGCGRLRHPPRPMCPQCRSLEWDTLRSSGRGAVYSYVIPHHPPVPPFTYPHVVGLIELEEGTRLVSNVIDIDPAEVRIGMPVEVCFISVDDDLVLPQFRPSVGNRER
jgi:uncharacterized OB-fold protein